MLWNPDFSWRNKYINGDPAQGHKKIKVLGFTFNYPDALTDTWHIAKIVREGCNILAILSALLIPSIGLLGVIVMLVVLSVTRNNAFNIFWNKLLLK